MANDVYDCTHERLRFVGGGYQIFCAKCGARWVAVGDEDEDLDYRRGISGVQGNLTDQERVMP